MDTSGVHLWLIVWKTYMALREHAERHIESLGLGLSDFGVLESLLHKGPLPVNTIGGMLQLTSGSITAAIDRLESKGFVQRNCGVEDRRTRMVHLTDAGRRLIEGAFRTHEEAMERATSVLDPQERARLIELLKKLGLGAQQISANTTLVQ